MTSINPESLQKHPHSRGLEKCLVGSVIILFITVAAACVCFFIVIQGMQLEREQKKDLAFGQNCAHLLGNTVLLKNVTMEWSSSKGMGQAFVGDQFSYDNDLHMLNTKAQGVFYLYLQMNVRCTGPRCKAAGRVTITVFNSDDGDRSVALECAIDIPTDSSTKPISKNCVSLVSVLEGNKIYAHLTFSGERDTDWQLDNTDFGIFLV
ncbi:tumor necrosis factor ligand superfamily member 9-like [Acipenser ruthenus]|uniref:tumor necrosis factor ligand superfamily member 9-like n=1 Tax=Acipenser ruthenus TaxID=7906 RepID=UPI0015619765|nr:tumor necrosis factor ligand superfamily member 9-like [Acipenser ruthenus]